MAEHISSASHKMQGDSTTPAASPGLGELYKAKIHNHEEEAINHFKLITITHTLFQTAPSYP